MRSGAANSHKGKGWETFTDKVIEIVDKYGGASLGETNGVGRGIVFMGWGQDGAKRVEKLDKVCAILLLDLTSSSDRTKPLLILCRPGATLFITEEAPDTT